MRQDNTLHFPDAPTETSGDNQGNCDVPLVNTMVNDLAGLNEMVAKYLVSDDIHSMDIKASTFTGLIGIQFMTWDGPDEEGCASGGSCDTSGIIYSGSSGFAATI